MRAATAARTMRNWWPWRTISALPRTICWGGATCGVESVSCACWGRRPRRPAGKTSPGMCRGGYQPPGEMQAAGRRPRGSGSRQGACPARMHPPFSFPSCGKENGPCTVQKKRPLGALRRVRASARRGSADRCKRRFWPAFGHAMLFCDFCNCRPVADGADLVGVVVALPLFLFSLPLAVPRRNWCNGRMWASARKHKPLRPPGQRVAKRNARKEELVKCVLAPRPKTHPRRGNPPSSLYRTPPRPSGSHRRPAGTISRRPPYSNFARTCKVAAKAPFSLTPGAARSLFG